MYGVLGLTKIEDEEGSSAYLYGKDLQRNRQSTMVAMYPNLYQDHEANKRLFYSGVEEKKKEIDENQRMLNRIRRKSSSTYQNEPSHPYDMNNTTS